MGRNVIKNTLTSDKKLGGGCPLAITAQSGKWVSTMVAFVPSYEWCYLWDEGHPQLRQITETWEGIMIINKNRYVLFLDCS